MKCPKCGKEITELNWWENKLVKVGIETMELEPTGENEYEFDCPECGAELTMCHEIQNIVEKLYGGENG